MAKPPLGPPKGADAAVQALDRVATEAAAGDRSGPAWPNRAPADTPRHSRGRRRTEPVGMTRKTYYLTSAAADALDRAVDEVVRATGGTISKHTALGAIIAAGVGQSGAVAQQLRNELMSVLTSQDSEK